MTLVPFEVWFRPAPGPLLAQVHRVLVEFAREPGAHQGGEPLRWAITAADPVRGLRLEGVLVAGDAP